MAFRPTRFLIKGFLDNTQPGKITGWMRFAGMNEKVTFNLEGNFCPDIQGTQIYFTGDAKGDEPDAESRMEGFSKQQTGKAGYMTADFHSPDYDFVCCYLEWYSKTTGRCVLAFDRNRVYVIGTRLPPEQCKPIDPEKQAENLHEFLCDACRAMDKTRNKQADENQPACSGQMSQALKTIKGTSPQRLS